MHELLHLRRSLISFRGSLLPQVFTDTLVIGGGVAGLRAAIAAAAHGDVIVLCKRAPQACATERAQGGVAVVTSSDDSVQSHVADTLLAGAGLCDAPVVREIVGRGAPRLDELLSWGMQLDRKSDGEPALAREGGHSASRIVHTHGDATGRELLRCLLEKARSSKNIRLFEHCAALDLLTPGDQGERTPCMGAITHHKQYGLQLIWAHATILATGGAGLLWRETTNPDVTTGDGVAMAWRAGASVADMAFMQFHPTTLYIAGASRALISEAVRGEGALLVDRSGDRFMLDAHEMAELAPRDVVSCAIHRRLARDGQTHVFLDARSIAGFPQRFPGIHALLARFDLDPARDLIPVRPAAHYSIGGVRTDIEGRTDVPGLYAAGEVASTGFHGANRLASNSLLEGLVMGDAAGQASQEMRRGDNAWGVVPPRAPAPINAQPPASNHGELDLDDVRSSVRAVMWRSVGVERSGAALRDVADLFDFWARYTLDKVFSEPAGWELQNMLLVGSLITRSALWRRESRGCHIRTDHPERDEALRVHDLWRRGEDEPQTTPVLTEVEAT